METREGLLRELFLLALGIGSVIAVVVGAVLWLGGAFSWVWFARATLLAGFAAGALEVLLLPRVLRITHVRGPSMSWRRVDRASGCSVAVLIALVALSLLACSIAITLLNVQ